MAQRLHDVTVVGCGLMGAGIAQVFASSPEFRVRTFDSVIPPADALERISANLKLLRENGAVTPDQARSALGRISARDTLESAVDGAQFVVECIPEQMELKQELFARLDALCPADAILATNTSVMSITAISQKARARDRIVGTHFWNPPYLVPLVEVVRSEHTAEAVMHATMEVLRQVGKSPIRVNKDVPGFVANRLQHALWREAISIVEHGIADAATVDEAVRQGFGLRLPVLGPIENADMVGTDLTLSIHAYLLKHLESSPEPSPLLREKVERGELGFKSGRGFRAWTAEEMDESRRRLTAHLIQAVLRKQ